MIVSTQDRYDSLFQHYGQRYSVDWKLLKAQAIAESNLNPYAKSPVGAEGLTQFMPTTWKEWGTGDVTNPEEAIKAQTKYMDWLLGQFNGSVTDALAAYNWGIGNMRKYLLNGGTMPEETQRYVARIVAMLT
jgi:soluble lytic murein transglycosylase-like protein